MVTTLIVVVVGLVVTLANLGPVELGAIAAALAGCLTIVFFPPSSVS